MANQYRDWTDEEVKFLKENYKEMTDEELGKALGRSASSISTRRSKHLNLIRDKMSNGRHYKYNFDYIKNYIENESNSGCKLISSEYINGSTPLTLTCARCGEEYKVTYNQFYSRKKYYCNDCSIIIQHDKQKHSYEFVNNYINNLGFTLISDKYENNRKKLILCDKEGYYYYTSFNILQNGKSPDRFSKYNPYTINNIILWCDLNKKPFKLIPLDVYNGSHHKLKWQCLKENCGEIFQASWNHVIKNHGCGACDGKQVTLSNCLATKNPKLAQEWHPTLNDVLTPYDVTENSHQIVWWQCSKNSKHEWETSVSDRNSGYGCPYCSGKRPSEDYNLLIVNPELCKEWDYIKNDRKPEDYTPNANKKVWWVCSNNKKHKWDAVISSRNGGKGCPYCAGLLPSEDYNLLVCNPGLCEEWDFTKNKKLPQNYTPNSSAEKIWWICRECGHNWNASISSRNSSNSGCPECNKSKGEKECKRIFISKGLIEINQEDYDKLLDVNKSNNIYFILQKEFDGLLGLGGKKLSYDFYIPKLNLLVEYQGEQHERYILGFHKSKKDFEKQLEHDRRKREYAMNNNINLLEIWYYDFDNIEKILSDYFNLKLA